MNIAQYAAFPRNVIRFLEIKEYCHNVLATHECLANESFLTQKLIDRIALLTKTTLTFRKNAVGFLKQTRRSLTSRLKVFHRQLVNAMGDSCLDRKRPCPALLRVSS